MIDLQFAFDLQDFESNNRDELFHSKYLFNNVE